MSFLHHFFASDTRLAEELARDEKLFRKSYVEYIDSVQLKQRAAADYEHDPSAANAALRRALATEIALNQGNNKSEEQIVDDLDALHSGKHRRAFENLKLLMDHALSQERYVYHVMGQLRQLLLDQAHTVVALRGNPGSAELIKGLRAQLELEGRMVQKLPNENLLPTYRSLALGMRVKDEIKSHQHALAESINDSMCKSWAMGGDANTGDAITDLTDHCFNSLEEQSADAVRDGHFNDNVARVFQYVNSSIFDNFVEKEAHRLRINREESRIFTKIFRDIYNQSLEQTLEQAQQDEQRKTE